MSDTTFDKSGMAMPGHPIPRTNDRTTVYRQPPGAVNSPNQAGGEVRNTTIADRAGSHWRPSLVGDSPVRR
jgi:hypothetical protein